MVAGLEPDRHQRQVRPVVHRALAHERGGDGDVETAREGAKVGRRATTQDAIAGQEDRPLRGGQQARGVGDRLVGRFGEVGPAGDERCRTAVVGAGTAIAARFSGSSMWVGPGFSSVATRNALRTISGMASMRSTRVFHLVTGSIIRTMSTTWWASLWSLSDRGLAGDRDHRRPVEVGVGDPVTRFVAPGPERRHRDRGAPGEAAVDIRHERRALLVAGGDVADGRASRQGVEDVHRLLAGNREDEFAAFGGEAVDEEVGGDVRWCGLGGHRAEDTGSAHVASPSGARVEDQKSAYSTTRVPTMPPSAWPGTEALDRIATGCPEDEPDRGRLAGPRRGVNVLDALDHPVVEHRIVVDEPQAHPLAGPDVDLGWVEPKLARGHGHVLGRCLDGPVRGEDPAGDADSDERDDRQEARVAQPRGPRPAPRRAGLRPDVEPRRRSELGTTLTTTRPSRRPPGPGS